MSSVISDRPGVGIALLTVIGHATGNVLAVLQEREIAAELGARRLGGPAEELAVEVSGFAVSELRDRSGRGAPTTSVGAGMKSSLEWVRVVSGFDLSSCRNSSVAIHPAEIKHRTARRSRESRPTSSPGCQRRNRRDDVALSTVDHPILLPVVDLRLETALGRETRRSSERRDRTHGGVELGRSVDDPRPNRT
jgi:hypothetical protein